MLFIKNDDFYSIYRMVWAHCIPLHQCRHFILKGVVTNTVSCKTGPERCRNSWFYLVVNINTIYVSSSYFIVFYLIQGGAPQFQAVLFFDSMKTSSIYIYVYLVYHKPKRYFKQLSINLQYRALPCKHVFMLEPGPTISFPKHPCSTSFFVTVEFCEERLAASVQKKSSSNWVSLWQSHLRASMRREQGLITYLVVHPS